MVSVRANDCLGAKEGDEVAQSMESCLNNLVLQLLQSHQHLWRWLEGEGEGAGGGRKAWSVYTTRTRGSTSGPNLWKHTFYELFPPNDGGKPRDVLQEDQADMEVPALQQVEQQWYDMGTGDGEGKTAYTIIEVNSD